jgi:glycosyltransferase involved in cell wall biosynthesis
VDGIARETGLDLIHAQHPWLLGPHGAHLARKLGIPLVFTHHSIYENFCHYIPLPKSAVRWYSIQGSISFSNKCDLVIVPTRSVYELVTARGVRAKVEIVPTGLDLSKFRDLNPEAVRDRYGISRDKKLVLYLGRMSREKAVGFILRSFYHLLTRRGDVLLMLTGDLENREIPDLIDQLDIGRYVILTGGVSYDQIQHYYAAADVFALASYGETQGLVLVEAMAAGTPVVAVDAIGVRDIVQNGSNGFLTPRDGSVFNERIEAILDNQELSQRLSQGGLKTSQLYSIDRLAGRMLELYGELIKERKIILGKDSVEK